MEIQIWSTLLWAFCEEKDIFGRMMGLLSLAFGEAEAQKKATEGEFQYCCAGWKQKDLSLRARETAEDAAMAASVLHNSAWEMQQAGKNAAVFEQHENGKGALLFTAGFCTDNA